MIQKLRAHKMSVQVLDLLVNLKMESQLEFAGEDFLVDLGSLGRSIKMDYSQVRSFANIIRYDDCLQCQSCV